MFLAIPTKEGGVAGYDNEDRRAKVYSGVTADLPSIEGGFG